LSIKVNVYEKKNYKGGWTRGHVEGMGYVSGDTYVFGSATPSTYFRAFGSVGDYMISQSTSSTGAYLDQILTILGEMPVVGHLFTAVSFLGTPAYPGRRDDAINTMLGSFLNNGGHNNTPFVIQTGPGGWGNNRRVTILNAATGEVIDSVLVSTNWF
jgi:hypothetical protein